MRTSLSRRRAVVLAAALVLGNVVVGAAAPVAVADGTTQPLPFAQAWSDPNLITASGNWSGVPGVVGYRGDALATTNADPQTVLADGAATPVDVVAQSTATGTAGGVHEVEAAGTVALQGSGTADAPHLVIRLATTGFTSVNVAYTLVDLDGDDGGAQQFALQYRVGGSGPYTNVPAGYVADASTTPPGAIPVSALLPAATADQPLVEVRIITTDTSGSDSMTGVDDIVITGTPIGGVAEPVATCPTSLVTPRGTAASAAVSATDADSAIDAITITSAPVAGITLTPTGAGAADLAVADTTAPGTYDVTIGFGTDDTPPQTTSCTVQVTVVGEVAIHTVQGGGAASPVAGQRVVVVGIATSLFTSSDAPDGFFLQEEDVDADADPATSEGLYVFCRGRCPAVAVGDRVEAYGTVAEFFGMTQVNANTASDRLAVLSSGNPLPTSTVTPLPAGGSTRDAATFEPVEGMVVTIPGTLVVSEYFELARYGQVVLTADSRPYQFTHVSEPDVGGYAAFLADLATRRIILDDDNNGQNDAVTGAVDEAYPWPQPGLSTTNRLRGGDTVTGLTAVMHWSFAGQAGTDAWRLRPIQGVGVAFAPAPPAPPAPSDVGGRLTVASFNVLNYFTTIDTTSSNEVGPCGPSGTLDCRGADSVAELDRQRAKTVAALAAIDADVVGLIEIQNDAGAAVADLVGALNALGASQYAYVDTGTIGTDAIKVALIYQPASVVPVGPFAVLDSSDDPRFRDTLNRPALIQTFEEVATGERFTVAVNHLKSKGSACNAVGDPDLLDGQGNCAVTRTLAAQALADHLAADPTSSGDPDVLIIGDLNSYRREDPITALRDAGYTDLIEQFGGSAAYSYVFDGQLGYLDHALAGEALLPQVTGATEWHVNADEVPLFDYNDTVRDAGEATFERESAVLPLYEADPRRSSDHDPVIVGLELNAPPVADAGGPYEVRVGRVVTLDAGASYDPVGDELSYAWDLDGDGEFDDAVGATPRVRGSRPPGTYEVAVQVSDGVTVDEDTAVLVVTLPEVVPPRT